ncbi:hypothetical protein BIW11_10828 [Tropilaelaps mercedesae]|uniref:C2H2-type domain-containing protein n=1 Tax=Tropilaelaps mercedesae TaxID=418985 RepID=A0A1V9XE75_9ACAR|nr:hypothetical protein BIW11_10828 [Tropilaelaps mercedesae]
MDEPHYPQTLQHHLQYQQQPHYQQHQLRQHQQRQAMDGRAGRYAEDYFPHEIHQFHDGPGTQPVNLKGKSGEASTMHSAQVPIEVGPSENAVSKPHVKDMSWEKVRKMNLYRLRTLPLDMVHVLDEGRKRQLRVVPLEGQQRKIEALENLNNVEFVSKCLEPLELRCDCCAVDFRGQNKLREMLDHIRTQQHFIKFRARMIEDPLYAYKMNKTSVIPPQPTVPNPANSKKKSKNVPPDHVAAVAQLKRNQHIGAPPGEDAPQASKKRKHADVPEEYRPMADWLACYVCNITCSSLSIYESHAVGKRHQRILSLAPEHVQALPWGPYLIDGKPTIDTGLGAVKIAVHAGQNIRVGGEQPQLVNSPWLEKVRSFVASKLSCKTEV